MASSGWVARRLEGSLLEQLARFPAVALLGPRQVGKTTLARQITQRQKDLMLDLESPADRAKLLRRYPLEPEQREGLEGSLHQVEPAGQQWDGRPDAPLPPGRRLSKRPPNLQ